MEFPSNPVQRQPQLQLLLRRKFSKEHAMAVQEDETAQDWQETKHPDG